MPKHICVLNTNAFYIFVKGLYILARVNIFYALVVGFPLELLTPHLFDCSWVFSLIILRQRHVGVAVWDVSPVVIAGCLSFGHEHQCPWIKLRFINPACCLEFLKGSCRVRGSLTLGTVSCWHQQLVNDQVR